MMPSEHYHAAQEILRAYHGGCSPCRTRRPRRKAAKSSRQHTASAFPRRPYRQAPAQPAPAALAIRGDKKIQAAWHEAETHAQALDNLVGVLAAAAELVRRPDQGSEIGGDRTSFLLPLTIDVKGQHRRKLWHAWRDEEVPEAGPLTRQALSAPEEPEPVRCGRWGRLARLHAKIRAGNVVDLQLFPSPRPYYVEFVPRPGGGHTQVRRDPEDTDPKSARSEQSWSVA